MIFLVLSYKAADRLASMG